MDGLIEQLESITMELKELRRREIQNEEKDKVKLLKPEFQRLKKLGWTYEQFWPEPMLRCIGNHYGVYYYGKLIENINCVNLDALLKTMNALSKKEKTNKKDKNPQKFYVDNAFNKKMNRVGKPYK